jgi:hypothetical protein
MTKSIKTFWLAALLGLFFSASSVAVAGGSVDDSTMAAEEGNGLQWLAVGVGAVTGIAVLNIVTGGLVMVPAVVAGIVDAGSAIGLIGVDGLLGTLEMTATWIPTALAGLAGGTLGAVLYDG